MELKFSECSLISLEKLFGLDALDDCPALQAWLTEKAEQRFDQYADCCTYLQRNAKAMSVAFASLAPFALRMR